MRLPNPEQAVVDIRKLRDYCLNANSPRGRTKARVFASVLGLEGGDAAFLQRTLLEAVLEQNCKRGEQDQFGRRYTVEFVLEVGMRKAWVRSGWIIRTGESFPG